MKTEDFELDIVKCKKDMLDNKKDEWQCVEFAKGLNTGTIFKIVDIDADKITYHLRHNRFAGQLFSYKKEVFKPSTEREYVEQLKKEAFEKFGEIKDGDRFDRTNLNFLPKIIEIKSTNISYDKSTDSFYVDDFIIYEKGKWATKLSKVKEVARFTYDLRLAEGCNARIITPEGREIIVN